MPRTTTTQAAPDPAQNTFVLVTEGPGRLGIRFPYDLDPPRLCPMCGGSGVMWHRIHGAYPEDEEWEDDVCYRCLGKGFLNQPNRPL